MLNGDGNENGIRSIDLISKTNKFAPAARFFVFICRCFARLQCRFVRLKRQSSKFHIIFMEELSYELTEDFVSCFHVRFYEHCRSFLPCCPLHFSFSPCRYEIFMFFFQRNSSPLFSITRPSSSSVIHVSVNIKKKKNVEKDTSFLLFFLSKSPGGDAISFQIKPSVAFGLGISTSCSATFSQLLV